jgi:hypothetical protein
MFFLKWETMMNFILWHFSLKISSRQNAIMRFTTRNYWQSYVASSNEDQNYCSLNQMFQSKCSRIIKIWNTFYSRNNWIDDKVDKRNFWSIFTLSSFICSKNLTIKQIFLLNVSRTYRIKRMIVKNNNIKFFYQSTDSIKTCKRSN